MNIFGRFFSALTAEAQRVSTQWQFGLEESNVTDSLAPPALVKPPVKIDVTRQREVDADGPVHGYAVPDLYRVAHDAQDRSEIVKGGHVNIDGVTYLDFHNAHDTAAEVLVAGPAVIIELLDRLGYSDVDPGPTPEDDEETDWPIGS